MKPVKRGDLAVLHTSSRLVSPYEVTRPASQYTLAVITSITRERHVKAVRQITGRDATAATRLDKLPRHGMVVLPAAEFRVSEAVAAVLESRACPKTGYLPPYPNPVDLLRDLHPWTIGDTTCLGDIRSAAYTYLYDGADQRCDDCGVTTYGTGRIDTTDGLPTVHCEPSCPVGVNYTTNYPVGLEIEIIDGFAAGATTRIERVSDVAFADIPPDAAGTRYYAGRSYSFTLPYWGYRTFDEDNVRPRDPQLADRYAVRREASTGS